MAEGLGPVFNVYTLQMLRSFFHTVKEEACAETW